MTSAGGIAQYKKVFHLMKIQNFFPLKKLKVVQGVPTFTKSFVVQYGSPIGHLIALNQCPLSLSDLYNLRSWKIKSAFHLLTPSKFYSAFFIEIEIDLEKLDPVLFLK